MKKTPLIISIIASLFLLFIILVIAEANGPSYYSWFPTYSKLDKNPYGCKLVEEALPALFPEKDIKTLSSSVFKQYEDEVMTLSYAVGFDYAEEVDEDIWFEEEDSSSEEDVVFASAAATDVTIDSLFYKELERLEINNYHEAFNLIHINYSFYLNDFDRKALLLHVFLGNHAFIAVENLTTFDDYLQVPISTIIVSASDSISLHLGKEKYPLKKETGESYFNITENKAVEVLATNNFDLPVLIRINYGKGSFILSSTPIIYTNYHLLHGNNQRYISKTLSYLPIEKTFWGSEYVSHENSTSGYSYFQFIMSEPALKWALILAICTMILFMLFGIKRKQKLIPPYPLPANKTIEYVETMSQLYLQRGENANIAHKKVLFFYDFIRSKFKLNPTSKKEDFFFTLAEQTGLESERLRSLFTFTNDLINKEKVSDDELLTLNKTVDKFINETIK